MYTSQEVIDVSSRGGAVVCEQAGERYAIHLFKNDVGNEVNCKVTCDLKSSLAPSLSTIYLQVYNHNSTSWETLDSNSTTAADTIFTLTAVISDLTNYKDIFKIISFRTYQLTL